jgi:hypothetical protein
VKLWSLKGVCTFAAASLFACIALQPAQAAEHATVAKEMAGVWLPDSRRSQRLPAQWPLRPEALAAVTEYRAKYGPIDATIDDANASCIPESMPYPVRLIAQYPFEILFTPDRVTMFFEIFGEIRRIPIKRDQPVLEKLPTAMGNSQAYWDEQTLVVTTTRIRREGVGKPSGDPPVSNARRFVERWSIGRDELGNKQLRNQISIHDPVVLTEPVTFQMAYKWSPTIEVGEYLCQQDIWDQNIQGSPSSVPWRQ